MEKGTISISEGGPDKSYKPKSTGTYKVTGHEKEGKGTVHDEVRSHNNQKE
ncbi:MAG: hypothetical protein LBU24_05245 [Methanocalculaceae archaeon]|nr:hypothetical protein [Methanocalculaceae archaeon]